MKYFCNRCHHEIKPQMDLSKMKIKGTIILNCWNCKKGKVVIKGEDKEVLDSDVKNEDGQKNG